MDELEKTLEEMRPKWIRFDPLNQPLLGVPYVVLDQHLRIDVAEYRPFDTENGNEWFSQGEGYFGGVTHYMDMAVLRHAVEAQPLPEPPKE